MAMEEHLCPRANNYGNDAWETRLKFEAYFNSEEGSVPWQFRHVRSCGEGLADALYQRKNYSFPSSTIYLTAIHYSLNTRQSSK